jgi:hypothetical protein
VKVVRDEAALDGVEIRVEASGLSSFALMPLFPKMRWIAAMTRQSIKASQ